MVPVLSCEFFPYRCILYYTLVLFVNRPRDKKRDFFYRGAFTPAINLTFTEAALTTRRDGRNKPKSCPPRFKALSS